VEERGERKGRGSRTNCDRLRAREGEGDRGAYGRDWNLATIDGRDQASGRLLDSECNYRDKEVKTATDCER
jgi:hypothetical protein